jgi:hypothetical protein
MLKHVVSVQLYHEIPGFQGHPHLMGRNAAQLLAFVSC